MKVTTLFAAIAATALLGACGDDGDDDDDDDDDDVIDTGVDAPPEIDAAVDAPGSLATRVATVAVIDITLANDLGAGPGAFRGAAVTTTFLDVSGPQVAPAYCTPDSECGVAGTCIVTVYDVKAGESAPPEVNEGTVTITGTLQDPAPPCNFIGELGAYFCPAQAGALTATATLSPGPQEGTAVINDTGTTFAEGAGGMFIQIAGSDVPGLDGAWPVAARFTDNVLVIPYPAGDAASLSGVQFTLLWGQGPTPGAVDFLDDDSMLTVSKVAGDGEFEAFETTVGSAGEGLTLATTSAQPDAVPLTAEEEVVFDCGGDGECGAAPIIAGLVVTGSTTDGDITGLSPIGMPAPVSKFATFTCSAIGGNSVTIPPEAWAAVLGTSPTRIDTRLLRVGFALFASTENPANAGRVLAGHGIVGFTDVPPK